MATQTAGKTFTILRCPECGQIYNPTERNGEQKRTHCMFHAVELERLEVVPKALADDLAKALEPWSFWSLGQQQPPWPVMKQQRDDGADALANYYRATNAV